MGANRVKTDQKISEVFLQYGVEVSVRVQRVYTILLLFTLKVTSVSEMCVTTSNGDMVYDNGMLSSLAC
jgi:hypothetical protein